MLKDTGWISNPGFLYWGVQGEASPPKKKKLFIETIATTRFSGDLTMRSYLTTHYS